jgi:hypothetical protein
MAFWRALLRISNNDYFQDKIQYKKGVSEGKRFFRFNKVPESGYLLYRLGWA